MLRNQLFLSFRPIIFSILFLLAPICLFGQNLNFSGRVTDKSTGQALKNIHVFVPNSTFQTFSDSLGRFTIPNIPAGRWEIALIGEDYEEIQEVIELKKTQVSNFGFSLLPTKKKAPPVLKLTEKKREKLVEDFTSNFLSTSKYQNQLRLLNPEGLVFFEEDNSKELMVDTNGYLIFINDQTGFLFTLYFNQPQSLENPISTDHLQLAFLDLINEVPELIEARNLEREKIFLNSPAFTLRQMLTGEISTSNEPEGIQVAFGKYQGEYLLTFPKPFVIQGKGSISYSDDQLPVRSEGAVVFEDQLMLEGDFSEIHPLDQLPRNFNGEKTLQLANIEKNAQVMQEKVFLQTDRSYYLKGETLFFKANMIYANPLLGPELSKVLHIEILDTTGYQEIHEIFKINQGKAFGSIELPVGLNQQNYLIRAYTSWSLNYGNHQGTILPIQILDPSLRPLNSTPETLAKKVSIFSDKQVYQAGELVNLNVMVRDDQGRPIASDLAIRVLDLSQSNPVNSSKTIEESFELSPVPIDTDFTKYQYTIESRFTVKGEIQDTDKNPIEGNVTALINGLGNIEKYKVGKDGEFEIPQLSFEGDFEIAVQGTSKEGLPIREISLKVEDYHLEGPLTHFNFPKLTSNNVPPLTAQEIQANMEQGEILLDEFVIDEEKSDPTGPMIYGQPDSSVDPSKLQLNGSTSQFIYLLAGQVAGMSVTGNPPSIRFRNGGEPLVMIDGVPVNPPSGPMIGGGSPAGRTATDIISGINVFAIERVEVIKRTVPMLGEAGRNGIISIFMKTGEELQKANDAIRNNFTPFKLQGFQKQKSFQEVVEEQQLNPLLRGLKPTLYWNPEVITNTEELSQAIQFKSSESAAPMWVEIKGITADGQPVEGKFVINQQ